MRAGRTSCRVLDVVRVLLNRPELHTTIKHSVSLDEAHGSIDVAQTYLLSLETERREGDGTDRQVRKGG